MPDLKKSYKKYFFSLLFEYLYIFAVVNYNEYLKLN